MSEPTQKVVLALAMRNDPVSGQIQVALIQHKNAPYAKDGWIFPGGKVEPNETLEAAALRELEEECGLNAKAIGPVLQRDSGDKRIHYIWCEVTDPSQQPRIGKPDKIHQAKWVDIDELHRYMPPDALGATLSSLVSQRQHLDRKRFGLDRAPSSSAGRY